MCSAKNQVLLTVCAKCAGNSYLLLLCGQSARGRLPIGFFFLLSLSWHRLKRETRERANAKHGKFFLQREFGIWRGGAGRLDGERGLAHKNWFSVDRDKKARVNHLRDADFFFVSLFPLDDVELSPLSTADILLQLLSLLLSLSLSTTGRTKEGADASYSIWMMHRELKGDRLWCWHFFLLKRRTTSVIACCCFVVVVAIGVTSL